MSTQDSNLGMAETDIGSDNVTRGLVSRPLIGISESILGVANEL